MEVTRLPDGVTIINDAYNANPDSVRAAIAALATMAEAGRGFAVLGHMTELGDDADRLHEEIGAAAAAAGLAGLIVVGDAGGPDAGRREGRAGLAGRAGASPGCRRGRARSSRPRARAATWCW